MRLVVEGGKHYSMQDITHILRQMNPDAFIVEEANTVKIQNVTFIFKDGVLVRVESGSGSTPFSRTALSTYGAHGG